MKIWIVLCLILAKTTNLARAHDDEDGEHGTSHLWIEAPDALADQYEDTFMHHREALFGIPSYGEEIEAKLIYATPGADELGCDPYPSSVSDKWEEEGEFILLIDRGTCNFVKKVRNAEEAGAVAVIIADSSCLSSDPFGYCDDFTKPSGGDATANPGTCTGGQAAHPLTCSGSENYLPFMANDGSGDNIRIPSFMVSSFDAQNLKSALCSKADKSTCASTDDYDQVVRISMEWDVPANDDHVDWEMWTSSEDWYGAEFKREFARVAKELEDASDFTPRYWIYDGVASNCQNSQQQNACPNNCINSGRYCANTPHGDFVDSLKGIDVVRENLRQMCIWKVVSEAGTEYKWWDYVVDFADQCFGEEGVTHETIETCSTEIQNDNEISASDVANCISSSGGYDLNGGENTLLQADLEEAKSMLIFELPSFIVNGALLRISPTYGPVLTAICAAYLDGTEPEICDSILDPSGTSEGTELLQVSVEVHFDEASFTVDEFNWQLQSEFRSQIAFKAGVSKTSTTLEDIKQKDANTLSMHVLFHHLTHDEVVDAIADLETARDHNDIRFYTAQSQSEGTRSILVTVDIVGGDGAYVTHHEDIEKNKFVTNQNGGTGTTDGVIVMLVLLTIAVIFLTFTVVALWRRVGLTSKDLNIFSDMIAIPSRLRPGSRMNDADPTGRYMRPLADEGNYAPMGEMGDDDDLQGPKKKGIVSVSVSADDIDDGVAL